MTKPKLHFSFDAYAKALSDVIVAAPSDGAFVVGITGPWGSGKTTLMRAVREHLDSAHFISVGFNAWAYSRQDAVWRGLFITILDAIRQNIETLWRNSEDVELSKLAADVEKRLDDAEAALYSAFTRDIPGEISLDTGRAARLGARLALKLVPWGDLSFLSELLAPSKAAEGTGKNAEGETIAADDMAEFWGMFKRQVAKHHVARIQSLEQFRKSLEEVLTLAVSGKRRLAVYIDDVDRCLPEHGLEVFEAIKLFLDLPGSAFVVAMDQGVLQHALDLRYGQTGQLERRVTAELYAEKMVDLAFAIPPSDETSFKPFVTRLPAADMIERAKELMQSVLPRVPRTWQRFAHRVAVHRAILDTLAKESNVRGVWELPGVESIFVKLQLLQFRWPIFFRVLGTYGALIIVERCIREAIVDSAGFTAAAIKTSGAAAIRERSTEGASLSLEVWRFLDDVELVRFLAQEPAFDTVSDNSDVRSLLEKMFSLELPQPTMERVAPQSDDNP